MKTIRTVSVSVMFLLAASAGTSCSRRAAPTNVGPAPADAPPALTIAHEAYLAGDWVEMGERLKEVIVDPQAGELAKDNAFALLESAYDATKGRLPARAALPPTVKSIMLGVLNGTNPFGAHRMVYLNVRVPDGRAAHVKDIRLTRLPSEPILALAAKRGTLQIKHVEPGFEDVDVEARGLEVLPDRGAFGIQIEFDDAPGIDTFLLASKLVASTQPEVTSPEVGGALKGSPSEVTWQPFRSPENARWEARTVWAGISRDKAQVWDFYQYDAAELGSAPISKSLEPGSYWISLLCSEERMFGGIGISRGSESGGPFTVVR